jgi:hypothetical protein
MSDIVEDYVNQRHKLQYTDGPYMRGLQSSLKVGIEPGYVMDTNTPNASLQASSDQAENDGGLAEDELVDVSSPEGAQWAKSSRHIYEMWNGAPSNTPRPMQLAGPQGPKTDEDYARWGVEFMGQFNYNMTKMAADYVKLRGLDEQTALNMVVMMQMYDELPNFTWNGTKRMFKGLATDPTTYAGLGSLGLGFIGRSAAKQMTKKTFAQALKNKLKNPYVIAALEGGAYGSIDDLLRQGVEIEAGVRDGVDPTQTLIAGGAGLALGPAFVGAIDAAPIVVRAVRDRLTQEGEMPVVGSNLGNLAAQETAKLNRKETASLKAAATKDGTLNQELFSQAQTEALRIKNEYPKGDGWLPIEINVDAKGPVFTLDKEGNVEIKWKQPAYAFHTPKGRMKALVHRQRLIDQTVTDVNAVLARAQAGDQAAIDIIKQANWYRSMRSRLRQEFGGLADVFADILGATSAQTNVQRNYENSLSVLRQFVRGEFDVEIKAYQEHLASGGKKGGALFARDKDEQDEFRLIRNAAGKMFGANSPAATEALLNMFRQVKVNQSPKTINFTGNLIGFGNEATIDVWAARYLRDIANLPRIPPPAEKAVAGKHLTGSTLDDPRIGGEFGFGQEVFSEAASALNNAGQIKAFDPNLGDIGPDDLQAIVWFMEKEKWTANGWTSKAGEGGSMDYESVFGGSPDRDRVKELRSIINAKFNPPKKLQKETDKEYATRLAQATKDNTASKIAAKAELQTLEGEPQRFVAGVSRERPDQIPTNPEQAELASELTAPLAADQKVIAYQANNTLGEFMGDTERALNFEIVTQTDFDPSEVTKSLVEAGRKYDQDAVFLSKVVPDGTQNARPGVEVYFKERQGVDYAQQITAILRAKGIDGFTFVTDARQADRVDVQAGTDDATAGLVGIRFQYIPEFDDAFDPANAEKIFDQKRKDLRKVLRDVSKIEGITYADVVNYETNVYKNTDRSGSEWIIGGTSYGEYLGTTATR